MGRKLPEGWISGLKLENIFDFQTKSKRKAGDGKNIGIYKFITSSQDIKKYIDEADYKNGEYLVFGTGGSASIHYINEEFSISSDNFIVKIKDNKNKFNEGLKTKYVYYYLEANRKIFDEGFTGSGIKHIGKDYIKNITFLAPTSPTEQQKIVDYLDKQFAFIDNMESEINTYKDKLEKLEKGILEEAFGNKNNLIKIENLFKLSSGNFVEQEEQKEGLLYDIYGGNGIIGKSNKFDIDGENIVIGRVGAKAGNVRLINGKERISDNALYISSYLKDFNKNYLYWALIFLDLNSKASVVNRPLISYKGIKDFEIYYPDLQTQKQIAYKLDKQFELINSTRQEIEKQIKNLKELRKAMLSDIFGGFE